MAEAEALSERKRILAWMLAGIGSALALAIAFHVGRGSQREAAAAQARAVETESRSFCGDLGFKSQSELFVHCVNGLADIRNHAREQLEQETTGLF